MDEQRVVGLCDDLYVTTYNRDNVRWMLSRALNEPELDQVCLPNQGKVLQWAEDWANENNATLTYVGSRGEATYGSLCDYLYYRVHRDPIA